MLGGSGGGFKDVLLFTLILGKIIQFDQHIFRRGLVEPPTIRIFIL